MLTKLEEKKSSRKPYPMSWEEQSILFGELPAHLQTMALFKVNTGCREQEVCKLKWDWEIAVAELGTSVFLIPADFGGRHERSGVKNGMSAWWCSTPWPYRSLRSSVVSARNGYSPTTAPQCTG